LRILNKGWGVILILFVRGFDEIDLTIRHSRLCFYSRRQVYEAKLAQVEDRRCKGYFDMTIRKKMKVKLELAFQPGSIDGKYYIELFDQFIRFQPRTFIKRHSIKAWDGRKHLKMIANALATDNLSIGDGDNNFLTTNIVSEKSCRIVQITQERSLLLPQDEEVERIISRDGFISAFLYNSDYMEVHSIASESTIAFGNYSSELLETMKNTPSKQGVHGREFDVRFNPGRRLLLGATPLIAAWKMWFGEPFFDIISKEKLLAFPYTSEIKQLSSGGLFVKLFDEIEKSHTKENMFNQWKWQEWVDYDSLIAKYQ
jgi:hypothetical protein